MIGSIVAIWVATGVVAPAPCPHLVVPVLEVRGRVVNVDGAPVAGAVVRLVRAGGRYSRPRTVRDVGVLDATTDAGGRFRARPLEAGERRVVVVEAAGFAPAFGKVAADPASLAEVEIELSRGAAVRGALVDADGKPVAGARVVLRDDDLDRWIDAFGYWAAGEIAGRELATASGPAGRFRFDHLGAGRYRAEAIAPGFASREITLRIAGEADLDLGDIVLGEGQALVGRVIDEAGRPVPGAEASVAEAEPARPRRLDRAAGPAAPVARADADGFFGMEGLPADEPLDVTVRAPGFLPETVSGLLLPHPERLRIVLRPASTLSGRVVDEGGRGVAGAHLLVEEPPQATFGVATTIEDGSYRIADLPPGRFTLHASAPGFAAAEVPIDVPAAGELANVTVELREGAVVEGSVTDADGRPVAASVMVAELRGEGLAQIAGGQRTDEAGRYRLTEVPVGSYVLQVQGDRRPALAVEIDVDPGVNRRDVVVPSGASLAGTVLDGAGRAIEGATVSAIPLDGFAEMPRMATTDAAGDFAVEGLRPGRCRIWTSADGFGPLVTEAMVVPPEGLSGIELRLPPPQALVGRVTGLPERSVGQVEVRAHGPGQAGPAEVFPDGSYRLEGVGPGGWQVIAISRAPRRTVEARVAVAEDAAETVLDIVFPEGAVVSGRVSHHGEPVDGADVRIVPDHGGSVASRTRWDGSFSLPGVVEGPAVLTVSARGRQLNATRSLVVEGDLEVEVEIVAVAVEGVVTSAASGEPLPGATVVVRSADPGSRDPRPYGRFGVPSGADGSFRVEGLYPGSWIVEAAREGYAKADEEVTIGANDGRDGAVAVRLELRPTPGAELRLRGLGPGIGRASAVAYGADGSTVGWDYAPVVGDRLLLPDLPPGLWTVELFVGAFAGVAAVEVPGVPTAVDLVPAAWLEVGVPAAADGGVPVDLAIFGTDGRPRPLFASSSGTTRVVSPGSRLEIRLVPGSWSVRFAAADGRVAEVEVGLAPGERRRLDGPAAAGD